MSIPICFSEIIGFSRSECDCVDAEWSDDYSISESGLYISDLPGMPPGFIDSLGGCFTLWEKMSNSLENAIATFKLDVLGEILKYKEPARSRFKGDIGGKAFTSTITDHTYHGIRMYSDVRGGSFILRGIYLLLNVTEAVTLEIYDEYDLLYTYHLQSQAGRPYYNAITPITLPLKDEEGSFSGNYYFLYTTTGLPYNNKIGCNCAGQHWCFNPVQPCYHGSRDNWTEWSMIGGVAGDILADRDEWGVSRDAQGLILNGEFTCDIFGSLCSAGSDWVNNDIDFAIANAIWYKTGEYLSVYIRDTEEVSRKVLLGVEQWNANMAFYTARYQTLVNYIAENYEEDRNECLKCKAVLGYKKRVQML